MTAPLDLPVELSEQPPVVITEPGVYDIPEDLYHADPVPRGSLSSSGARKLLPPSCPARFWWEREHGQPRRKVFDFGHAAHKLVLGSGQDLVVVEAEGWRTKDAQRQRKEAYAAGAVPLLAHEYGAVEAMATAIRAHPIASVLFGGGRGAPEQSLFWRDERSGIMRRARLDWNPTPAGSRLIVPDYKTTESASPESIAHSVHKYGYHQQARWNLDGIKALGLAGSYEPAFVFVIQEKAAPHLISVIELDAAALRVAAIQNREAIEVFQRCTQAGQWPGYSDDVELVSLPPWVENKYLERF